MTDELIAALQHCVRSGHNVTEGPAAWHRGPYPPISAAALAAAESRMGLLRPDGRPRSRRVLIALAAAILACGEACHGRDAKAVAIVKRELALLEPPAGIAPPDQQTGLGEMYAEGSQTYCVNDEKTAQRALDTMLRSAGWEPVSASTTADATIWHYRKDQGLGSLNLATQPQPCGRRFRIDVLEPL